VTGAPVRVVASIVGVVLAGCASIAPSKFAPSTVRSDANVHIWNATTMRLVIVVNRIGLDVVRPQTATTIPWDQLPSSPWVIEARSTTGRIFLVLDVLPADVRGAEIGSGTSAATTDLSCGRLAMYVGAMWSDPGPGHGNLEACDP
jgi:hypothetical protein